MTLELVWKATLILAFAGCATALLRRSSAARRHMVWRIAFAALLLLPAMPALRWDVPAGHLLFTAAQMAGAVEVTGRQGDSGWLAWIWIAGALLLLVRLGLAHARMARLVGVPAEPVVHAPVAAPLTWGLWRPSVVLPPGDADPRDMAHELAHIARGDTRWLLVTQVACAVYWFHPLVWLAARKAAAERERACDDVVLAGGVEPIDYAERLVEAARAVPAAAAGMGPEGGLEQRVRSILDPRVNRAPARARFAVCATLVAAAVIIPLAVLRAQDDAKGGEAVTKPRLLYKVEPQYSEEARAAGVSGRMRLAVTIGAEGTATRIDVLDSLGYGLDERAVGAVRQWLFEPARKNGKAVAAEATIEINWRLE